MFFRGRRLLLKSVMLRLDQTMSFSAVVKIMLNKDKDIYLQESIEDGQYITASRDLGQSAYLMVRFVHYMIMKISNHSQWWFQRNIFTSLISLSPSDITHMAEEFIISRIQHWSLRTLTQSTGWPDSTLLHIWPHLRDTRWRLLAALPLPFYVKSFWNQSV